MSARVTLVGSDDELGLLGDRFNEMAARQRYNAELEEAVARRPSVGPRRRPP